MAVLRHVALFRHLPPNMAAPMASMMADDKTKTMHKTSEKNTLHTKFPTFHPKTLHRNENHTRPTYPLRHEVENGDFADIFPYFKRKTQTGISKLIKN